MRNKGDVQAPRAPQSMLAEQERKHRLAKLRQKNQAIKRIKQKKDR